MKALILFFLCAIALPAAALEMREQGAVRYLTGGVGEDERAQMDQRRGEFNLELIFAARGGGNYLADVDVAVLDSSGQEVLRTTADGPRVLAQLPPGRYTVVAGFDAKVQRRTVSVPRKGTRQVALYWEDPSVAALPVMEPDRASSGGSSQ
jgi:hypothetical protein